MPSYPKSQLLSRSPVIRGLKWQQCTFKTRQNTNKKSKTQNQNTLKKIFSNENKYTWKTTSSYQYFRKIKVYYKTYPIHPRGFQFVFLKLPLSVVCDERTTWWSSQALGMKSYSSASPAMQPWTLMSTFCASGSSFKNGDIRLYPT